MEMILLPILAFLGLVFLVDTGTDDDLDNTPAPEINPDLNRQSFGAEDDITTGTDVTDFLFLNDGDDMASSGAGDDKVFLGDGADQTAVLNEDGSFDTAGMEGDGSDPWQQWPRYSDRCAGQQHYLWRPWLRPDQHR